MDGSGAPKNEEFVNPLIPIYKEYNSEEGRKRTEVEGKVSFDIPYVVIYGFNIFTDKVKPYEGR